MEQNVRPFHHIGYGLFHLFAVAIALYASSMEDQIIDAAMAQKLQTNAFRDQPLVGWVIKQDLPDYPDEFVARLFNGSLAPYILTTSTPQDF